MLKLLKMLQLFADGAGDAGDGGAVETGEEVPAFIPEKAKKNYLKATAKMPKRTGSEVDSEPPKAEERKTYADIIKSDEYKDEHKAYMDKTIGERFKKYKGMEDTNKAYKDILDIVATKYGIAPDSENFLESLKAKAEEDDSYYEDYAMEHDISAEDARKIVTMERKIKAIEAEKAEAEKQEQARAHIMQLQQNAERTRAQFPEFDLETALQDERFRRICYATNGDTTSAYMATNYANIIPKQMHMVAENTKKQTAMSIASGHSRPIENGVSSQASSVVTTDFSKMNARELRAYAEEQRRKMRK